MSVRVRLDHMLHHALWNKWVNGGNLNPIWIPGVPVDGGPCHSENPNIKKTINCVKNGFHVWNVQSKLSVFLSCAVITPAVQFRISCCVIKNGNGNIFEIPLREIGKIPQVGSRLSPPDHTGGFTISPTHFYFDQYWQLTQPHKNVSLPLN